jgi:hypothetical protein
MADFMIPPPNALIAPTGPVWLDEDGIMITINTSAIHTREDAIVNMKITSEAGKGIPRPFLIDLTSVRSMSKAAREEYVKPGSENIINAVALLTTSNIGRMVGNLFIGFNKHIVPIKLFNDAAEAKAWLLQYKVK